MQIDGRCRCRCRCIQGSDPRVWEGEIILRTRHLEQELPGSKISQDTEKESSQNTPSNICKVRTAQL
jgi:hypothetical protein